MTPHFAFHFAAPAAASGLRVSCCILYIGVTAGTFTPKLSLYTGSDGLMALFFSGCWSVEISAKSSGEFSTRAALLPNVRHGCGAVAPALITCA